jgi:hypothetical protein
MAEGRADGRRGHRRAEHRRAASAHPARHTSLATRSMANASGSYSVPPNSRISVSWVSSSSSGGELALLAAGAPAGARPLQSQTAAAAQHPR